MIQRLLRAYHTFLNETAKILNEKLYRVTSIHSDDKVMSVSEKYKTPGPSRKISGDMYNHLHPSFITIDHSNELTEDHFTIVPTANLFFQDAVERIESAQSTVDLQFYTLEADSEVMRILDACRGAAERGVDIRIIVDHLVSDPRQLKPTLAM